MRTERRRRRRLVKGLMRDWEYVRTYVHTSIGVATRKRRQRPSKRNARSTFLLFFPPFLTSQHHTSSVSIVATRQSRDFRPTYPTNNEIPMTYVLGRHLPTYTHRYIIYVFISEPFSSLFHPLFPFYLSSTIKAENIELSVRGKWNNKLHWTQIYL